MQLLFMKTMKKSTSKHWTAFHTNISNKTAKTQNNKKEGFIMINLKNLCKDRDNEITLTNNFNESIYLDVTGNLLDGEFDYGSRGLDHNILKAITIEWIDLHNGGLVRLVPETKTALISQNQKLTPIQEKLIKTNHYEIETYI